MNRSSSYEDRGEGYNDDYGHGLRADNDGRRGSQPYSRGMRIAPDESVRSLSPSRVSRPPRTLSPSMPGHRQSLPGRIESLGRRLIILCDLLTNKRRVLNLRKDQMAREREALEEELSEKSRTTTRLRGKLDSLADDLEKLKENQEHAENIRQSRLVSLDMDEDDALQQARSQVADDTSETTAEKMQKIQEQKAALNEEHRLEAESMKLIEQRLWDGMAETQLRIDTLWEGRDHNDELNKKDVEHRNERIELRRDMEEHEQIIHDLCVELDTLRQEELELEAYDGPRPSHTPHGSRRPYWEDEDYSSAGHIEEPPPPPPPPYQTKRYEGTRLVEDRWEESDSYYTFDDVEEDGLSVSMPLNREVLATPMAARSDVSPLTPEASAWEWPNINLSDGQSSTELFVVHASEYSTDEMGMGRTTLVCPAGPPKKQDTESAVQMRWLYDTS